MGKEPTKQITIHFLGEDQVKVLEWMKSEAKRTYRTTEQHIAYCLSKFVEMVEKEHDIVDNLMKAIVKHDLMKPVNDDATGGTEDASEDEDPNQLKLFDEDGNPTEEAK